MRAALAVIAATFAAVVLMAARPGDQFRLFTQLNGQPVRWTLPDGGFSGLYAASGIACMPLSGGTTINGSGAAVSFTPSVVLLETSTASNVCFRPSQVSPKWDAGCNLTDTDENFGVPTQAFVPQYVVLDVAATQICAVSDAGTVRVSVWGVQ